MKKAIVFCLTVVLVCMISSFAMAEGKGKTACLIDPPANFVCAVDFSSEVVICSWDALEGANKYAFEIVFEIPLMEDPVATQQVKFHAGTTETSITVTFEELQALLDPFGVNLLGQSAIAKVKGLNPPQKGACSQANTQAETMLDFTPPTPAE